MFLVLTTHRGKENIFFLIHTIAYVKCKKLNLIGVLKAHLVVKHNPSKQRKQERY